MIDTLEEQSEYNMPRRRSPSPFRSILVVGMIFICVLAAVFVWLLDSLPRRAAEEFGAPSPSLTTFDRLSYSIRLYLNRDDLTEPGYPGSTPREFAVGLGEPVDSIGARLQLEGIIRNAQAFRLYVIYSGLDKTIQAGNYELNPGQSTIEIAQELQDATPRVVTFNLLSGWRMEEIATALSLSGLPVRQNEIIEIMRAPQAILPEGWPEMETLEGFLLPGEYRLERELLPRDIVLRFLLSFDEQVNLNLRQAFERRGLSLYEAVTLASVVEKESVLEEEMPLIASVFYNRLAVGMKLDSDPTVQYAIGYNNNFDTWWTNPLSLDDLQYNSPYNTYIYTGLPPGPIANPSLTALQAVAFPAETPYYFFRASCDRSGRHEFAVTYEEHIQNACP